MENNQEFNLRKAQLSYYLTIFSYICLYIFLWFYYIPFIEKYFSLSERVTIIFNILVAIPASIILIPNIKTIFVNPSKTFPVFECNNCHYQRRIVPSVNINKVIEFILWLLFIVPGFGFYMYKLSNIFKCKKCNAGFLQSTKDPLPVKNLAIEILGWIVPATFLGITAFLMFYYSAEKKADNVFSILVIMIMALLTFYLFRCLAANKVCDCGFAGKPVKVKTKRDLIEILFWGLGLLHFSLLVLSLAFMYSIFARKKEIYICSSCKKQLYPMQNKKDLKIKEIK